jgi:NAD(P)-dependent dehydrogenase (short-subunit alcohol dehydrogenase family)
MSTNPAPLTVLVVGAASGLGRAVATQLADASHRVLAVGRDPNHAATLTTALQERSGADPALLIADVSTRQGWHDVSSWTEQNATRLDGVVHNAGVMLPTRHTTSDGYETNFAVRHRAPFALTSRLLPLLRQRAVPDGPGGRALPRVIKVNSAGHQASLGGHSNPTLDFADLQAERDYNPFLVYSRTKLANLLFSYELTRRHGHELAVTALHPGLVKSNLGREFSQLRVAAVQAFGTSPMGNADSRQVQRQSVTAL